MESVAYILMGLGSIASIVGFIWFVICGFKNGVLWGIGCIICFPAQIMFLISHWEDAQNPFLLWAMGMLLSFGGHQMLIR